MMVVVAAKVVMAVMVVVINLAIITSMVGIGYGVDKNGGVMRIIVMRVLLDLLRGHSINVAYSYMC